MGIHIVGVDLSVTATGLADSTGRTGRVGRPGITVMELPERLAALRQLGGRIHRWIQDGIPPGTVGPILLCIEGLEARQRHVSGGASERAFMWHWLVDYHLSRGDAVVAVNPSKIKQFATGHGDANKREMITAARSWGWVVGGDDNKADAATLVAIGTTLLGGSAPAGAMKDALGGVIVNAISDNIIREKVRHAGSEAVNVVAEPEGKRPRRARRGKKAST